MALSTLVPYLPLCSALLLPLVLFLSIWRKNHTKQNLPPGPTKLPIIGNLHQLGKVPHRSLFQLAQKHGPLMYLKLGSIPTIVASSAKTAKEFLKTHDLDCCSRPLVTAATKLSYNYSNLVCNPYGDEWRELRKICTDEFFSAKKVIMFHSIWDEEVDRMINSVSSQTGSVVNLSAEVLALSNEVISRAAVGRRYYNRETGEGSKFPEMIREVQAVAAGFFIADYVPMLGWLDKLTGMEARLDKIFGEFDEFYQKVIDEHTDTTRRDHGGEDTLDALIRIRKESTFLTMQHLKALIADILLGGSDTTSSVLEWAMTELMRNPEAMKKAQEEVRGLIGKKGKVEENDIHQLNYMKCIVKESMRLHPPAPLLVPRETMRQCTIEGFVIPAKTRVFINVWAIGREEASWENPFEFKPERFIGKNIDVKGHDFELLPFGAGRRICPGMHIGMAVVELAFANLLYSFDWALPRGMSKEDLDMDEASGITVHRNSDLQLVATKYIGAK